MRGVIFLQVALLVLRAVFRTDFVEQLPAILRLLARLTNEVGAIEYVVTVLRYVSGVRADATPELLRQAIDAASIDAGEHMMSNWVEELIEQGMEKGLEQGLESKTEEAVRLVENLLRHRFGPLDASLHAALYSSLSSGLKR